MSLVLLIAAAVLVPQDSADPYYKFKVGTTWKLESTGDAPKGTKLSKIELKVVKEEAGKVELESKTYQGDREEVKTLRWAVAGGILTWAELHEGAERDVVQFYKAGTKKGDTWEWTDAGRTAKAIHLGTEEVKVAAGTYKDSVRVRCEVKDEGVTIGLEAWLAPGTGPVKVAMYIGETAAAVLELKEFKAAK